MHTCIQDAKLPFPWLPALSLTAELETRLHCRGIESLFPMPWVSGALAKQVGQKCGCLIANSCHSGAGKLTGWMWVQLHPWLGL